MVQIRPLDDRVLVKPIESEEKTAGGIILPDAAKEKSIQGEVVAVGPGKMTTDGVRVSLELQLGDRVIYSKYGGTEVKFDGQEYLLLREDDVLAVFGK